LTDTNLIEVGQVLRVAPLTPKPNAAAAEPAPGVVIKGITSSKVDIKPLDIENKPKNVSPAFSASAPSSAASSAASSPVSAPSADLHQVKRGEDGIEWGWPAAGPVAFGFDKATPKGLVIEGKAGDPVFAAADGHVVYAGSGLRGYGNLVIIKHTANYLTAYAHNQKLLVKEDSSVKRGQRIAEMGASEAQKVQLHFEVRRQGKPIDPEKVLPVR
jgi:lipoprotein NlpD